MLFVHPISQKQRPVLCRQSLQAMVQTSQFFLALDLVIECLHRAARIGNSTLAWQRLQGDGFEILLLRLMPDSLGYSPGKALDVLDRFRCQLTRNSVQRDVRQILGGKTGTPCKEPNQLPADYFILLAGAFRPSVQTLK